MKASEQGCKNMNKALKTMKAFSKMTAKNDEMLKEKRCKKGKDKVY